MHSPRLLIQRIVIFSGLALCGSVLKADIITSARDSLTDGNGVIVADGTVENSVAIAAPVLTSNYDFSSIEFVASAKTPNPSKTGTIGIYADNGGVPAG